MSGRAIYVSIRIVAPMERVWQLTQDPALHARWDVRFSLITPTAPLAGGGTRFVYERRLPGMTITGTGTTIGERERPDGTRTSQRACNAGSWVSCHTRSIGAPMRMLT